VAEYGLRQVFPRVPDHPALAGIKTENLRDWRGEATLLPPRLKYELPSGHGPTIQWCGLPVTQVWRCGNRGNVASVLIEKPARGNFLPLLEGGFGLQYSPLLEYREGKGSVLFCQMDVTARSEPDPAANALIRNLLHYATAIGSPPPSSSSPLPSDGRGVRGEGRKALYAGDPAGKAWLESTGVSVTSYERGPLSLDQVLILGPNSGQNLADQAPAIATWLKAGGNLLAVGVDQADVNDLLPFKLTLKKAEHISTWFDPLGNNSLLAGIGPADVHSRDPRELPLVSSGAQVVGDGVLAQADRLNVVFSQLAPWQFANINQSNLKRTYRRASYVVSRLLANMGVAGSTPMLAHFHLGADAAEKRWLDGLYLDQPQEWDDPYRFFRW
jgi:hypothetical protein